MNKRCEERPSDSPFVQTIWRTQKEEDGCYVACAEGNWNLIILKQDGTTRLLLAGPMTKATSIAYKADMEYLGIRFQIGIFMPHMLTSTLLNRTITLPATRTSFWFGDRTWQVPDRDNVDIFVNHLARKGLLLRDGVIDAFLQQQPHDLSLRSAQRRFRRSTGLTHSDLRQIERARHAMALLQQGVSILDTVHQLGYFDQSHLTTSLRRLTGYTPAQLACASEWEPESDLPP